ncbi:MAG: sulfurtransferase, partial [Desulfobacteraceae bacterium]
EIKHQERILGEYATLVGTPVGREEFNRRRLAPAMEGGLTTEEYLARQRPDVENPLEVAALAMAIEAQAMDLYQRAADRAASPASREMLARIARDEQSHLEHLGALFKVLQ